MIYSLIFIFYALTIFITVTEFFPEQIDHYIDTFFSHTEYYETSRSNITFRQVIKNEEFLDTFGTLDDSLLRLRYNEPINFTLFEMVTTNGFTINENPFFDIHTFSSYLPEIILEKQNLYRWKKLDYKIIDSLESEYFNSDSLPMIKNGQSTFRTLNATSYRINKLSAGNYRIRTNFFNNPALVSFKVYDTIPSQWEINQQEFVQLDSINVNINTYMDTKYFYIGIDGLSTPLLNWKYWVYKNGKWSKENWLIEFMSCGTGLNSFLSEKKSSINFKNYNYLFISLTIGFGWYLKDNKLSEPDFDIDSFLGFDQKPYDSIYYKHPNYKKFIKEEFGDSIALQLTFMVYPLYWSKYNCQQICSPVFKLKTQELYNNLVHKIEAYSQQ
ncbi:MAG: hypothetical protein IPM56_18330 [Ignavibacteriales bacterium]|nr:MAG: hypothetical protein IPM56_18330 [Ignavibacteriales bacterium]